MSLSFFDFSKNESVNSGRVHLLQYQLSVSIKTCGGLVAYARSDLACDRKMNLEYQTIESICIEININNRKWLISGLYRPPSLFVLI
jgi:hypothetical protein